jgi:hypothetical protein
MTSHRSRPGRSSGSKHVCGIAVAATCAENCQQGLVERYPAADAAFAADSIVRDEGSVLSDVDLVVLHRELPRAWRQAFLVHGAMLAEGHIIGPRQGDAVASFDALFKHGDPKPLIVFMERELSPLGGFLFDGFRRDAPLLSTDCDQK